MLAVVIDDVIMRVGSETSDEAKLLLGVFAGELARLRMAIREGATVEEFTEARKPKEAGNNGRFSH